MTPDKISAYKTLHHAIVTVAKLSAPFVPFITEQIYQNLVVRFSPKGETESVHLSDFPTPDESLINAALESQMGLVMDIVVQGRAARNIANTKIRQPLPEMLVALTKPETVGEDLLDVIKDELNVKQINFISDASEYTAHKFKPQLRTLGPKYGKLVPKITEALNATPSENMAALKSGMLKLEIDGTPVELTMDDVLVETLQKEGFSAASEKGVTVVLDIKLTPELIEEGTVRELISKWQNMRREADFEVTDHIKAGFDVLGLSGSAQLSSVVERNSTAISGEILASSIDASAPPSGAFSKEWNINGEKILLWVMK
jgi:isoleucyl-tRNA synthetase